MGKVISLNTGRRKKQPAKRKFKCKHKSITVYEQSRTVRCSYCGEPIDPFDALLDLVKAYSPEDEYDI